MLVEPWHERLPLLSRVAHVSPCSNTLVSSLALVQELQVRTLTLNVQAVLGGTSPAPLTLIVPSIVLAELDGLKRSAEPRGPADAGGSRRTLGAAARDATRWILQAVQVQKHLRLRGPAGEDVSLPQSAWSLHVQLSQHERSMALPVTMVSRLRHLDARLQLAHIPSQSPDDRIIALAVHLQAETGLTALLFSSDVNCRARAEVEGLRTLAVHEVLGRPGAASQLAPTAQESQLAVTQLLQQWSLQIEEASTSTSMHAQPMRQQADMSYRTPAVLIDDEMEDVKIEPAGVPARVVAQPATNPALQHAAAHHADSGLAHFTPSSCTPELNPHTTFGSDRGAAKAWSGATARSGTSSSASFWASSSTSTRRQQW
jgi:hypothetical protein